MQGLPQQDAVRVDVALVVVLLVTDDLRCHVAVGARLGGVVLAPEARRDAKVGHLGVARLVEQDVCRAHVAVHHAIGVRKCERHEQLMDVVPNVYVCEGGIQQFEVCVGHVFKHQRRSFAARVAHSVEQLDHIRTATQILQDLDLEIIHFL